MSAVDLEPRSAEPYLSWFFPMPARKVKPQVCTNTPLDPPSIRWNVDIRLNSSELPWLRIRPVASNFVERTCHANPKTICETRRLGGSAASEFRQISGIAARKSVGRQGFRTPED